ncbi:hypothetical protein [Symbioplanes lichenis]|uniref:hypothetical protein n=1 Tax=Symbioplanes lichenis TaxID=1629072 RepID=UPI0027389D4E|nr:hypothetical protein [Actinoplanes lichenis]
MQLIEIDVREFLARTVAAAERCDFAAVCIVVARSADRPDLLGAVTDTWTSLHSVTDKLIAIACPMPGREPDVPGSFEQWVSPRTHGEALGVRGFTVEHGRAAFPAWQQAFWDGGGPLAAEYRTVPPGRIADSPPPEDKVRRGGTNAVEQLKRLLGLPEEAVPCIVVLSMWEHRLVVVPVAGAADPYGFFKRLVTALGDRVDTVSELRSELRALEDGAARAADRHKDAELALREARGRVRHWRNRVAFFMSEVRAAGVDDPGLEEALYEAWRAPDAALERLKNLRGRLPGERFLVRLDSMRRQIRAGLNGLVDSMRLVAEAEPHSAAEWAGRRIECLARYDRAKQSLALTGALAAAVGPGELRRIRRGAAHPPPGWTAEVLAPPAGPTIPTTRTRN